MPAKCFEAFLGVQIGMWTDVYHVFTHAQKSDGFLQSNMT